MHQADLNHPNQQLQNKLERIFQLRRTTTKVNWDSENFQRLLEHFGNPHKNLPPVIHVAGTNGKGSVIAFLKAILEADGKNVHVYTSPHLVRVNERVVLSGEEISDDYLERLIDSALDFAGETPLSFFEIMTAIAFRAFSEVPADIVLLEVGMGGRLDCTNVIDDPLVSVINRISMDHTEFLGKTIEKIASEKSGIMRQNVPCVVGYQGEGQDAKVIENVLRQEAYQNGTSMRFIGDEVMQASLAGIHQQRNAALAIAALDCVSNVFPVSNAAIIYGLENAVWRGRLQSINAADLDLPETLEVWLDSGHNDSAGEALALHFGARDEKVHMILGMLQMKDANAFISPMRPFLKAIHVVPVQEEMIQLQIDTDFPITPCKNIRIAFEAIQKTDKKATVLIAGSVYLAGEILQIVQESKDKRVENYG